MTACEVCPRISLESLRKSHLTTEAQVSPLADSRMQSLQFVTVRFRIGFCVLRHEFNKNEFSASHSADALNFSRRVTHFKFFCGRRS